MIPKTKRYYLLFLITWPLALLSWLGVLFVYFLWGQKLHLVGFTLQCDLKKDSWPTRTWYSRWGGTSFGYGAFYNTGRVGGPGMDTEIEVHEHRHGEQTEIAIVVTFVISVYNFFCGVDFIHCIIVYISGPILLYLAACFVAFMRGKNVYRGNLLEQDAYNFDEKNLPPDKK